MCKLMTVVCFVLTFALASTAYAVLPRVVGDFEGGTRDGWAGGLWGGPEWVTPVKGGVNPVDPENGEWQLMISDFPASWGPTAWLDVGAALGEEGMFDFTRMSDLHLIISVVKSEWDLGDFGWMNIIEDIVLQSDLNGWNQLGGNASCTQLVDGVWVPVLDVDPMTGEPGFKGRQSELWWDDPDAWVDGRHTFSLDLEFDAAGWDPTTYANIVLIGIYSGAARGEDIAPVPMMGNFYLDSVVMTPEPATIALLGLGGLALLRRKHA